DKAKAVRRNDEAQIHLLWGGNGEGHRNGCASVLVELRLNGEHCGHRKAVGVAAWHRIQDERAIKRGRRSRKGAEIRLDGGVLIAAGPRVDRAVACQSWIARRSVRV